MCNYLKRYICRRDKIIHEVFSDPFTVYSAKAYPGMNGNTKIKMALFFHIKKKSTYINHI